MPDVPAARTWTVTRRRRPEPERPPLPVHELAIPDDLIAWGKENARSFVHPWGQEVERLVQQGQDAPLDPNATERLLARLEALCFAAIRVGRGDLLLGLDIFTADWLGLVFEFERSDGTKAGFGKGQTWSYQELHALVETGMTSGSARFVEQCKAAVAGVFPRGQIRGIVHRGETPLRCAGCGCEDAVTWVEMQSGSSYCGTCYSDLVKPWPKIPGVNAPREKKKASKR